MSKLLWEPTKERIKNTNMFRFMNFINEKYSQNITEYQSLYQWSIENIPDFWAAMWEFAGIKASKPYDQIIDDLGKMPGAKWFSGTRLNFAENLLRYRDNQTSLIFNGEDQVTDPRVADVQRHLDVLHRERVAHGDGVGDNGDAFPNDPTETLDTDGDGDRRPRTLVAARCC